MVRKFFKFREVMAGALHILQLYFLRPLASLLVLRKKPFMVFHEKLRGIPLREVALLLLRHPLDKMKMVR
jgi:hypothetical protein